jgi:uncharacterized protein (DUF2141 family)
MMKQRSVLFILLVVLIGVMSLVGGSGCANIVPPLGGPRDSLPPVLVSATPKDSVRNFTGKKISFVFNEYVQLDQIQENLLVSPYPKITPTVESKLREVTVTLRDTLEENTTYSLNFGKAIKDVNEGNPATGFTYMFSTGAYLDSMEVNGQVILAETGKTDSTLIVILHTDFTDSAVANKRPRYVTRVDNQGRFVFHNLPAGEFAVYALKDEGGSKRYLSKAQLFAFADAPVNSQPKPEPVTLYAYVGKEDSVPKPTISLVKPGAKTQAADRRLRIETNLKEGQLGLLDTLRLSFNQAPLRTFDSTKVLLTNDKYEPITGYSLQLDTSGKKLTVLNKWAQGTAYNIILEKDFAEDTSGRALLRKDTLEFRTKKETDYGLVRLRIPALDLSKNPVLQLIKNDAVFYSHVFGNSKEFQARLFEPGEYGIRILYDDNKNGVWDPGNFFGVKRQPERVVPITQKANVRANWEEIKDILLQ